MLQEYDFLLHHIPGKTNTDILSWMFKYDVSEDNNNIEMFKNKMFIRQMLEEKLILETTIFLNRQLEIRTDPSFPVKSQN